LQQLGRLLVSSVFERPSLIPQVIKDYLRIGLRIVPEMRAMLAYPIEEKLPHLRVPAMLMRGARDAIVPQAWLDEAAMLLRAAPAVVLARWSHAVHYSAAAGVTQAIRPFLAGEAPGMAQLAPPGLQGRLTCRRA
jgi:pimeloyl-ACP methyl ester carboxylesterase